MPDRYTSPFKYTHCDLYADIFKLKYHVLLSEMSMRTILKQIPLPIQFAIRVRFDREGVNYLFSCVFWIMVGLKYLKIHKISLYSFLTENLQFYQHLH